MLKHDGASQSDALMSRLRMSALVTCMQLELCFKAQVCYLHLLIKLWQQTYRHACYKLTKGDSIIFWATHNCNKPTTTRNIQCQRISAANVRHRPIAVFFTDTALLAGYISKESVSKSS